MRKQRTREHIISDLSANYVERRFLLAGHTAERVRLDYGYDLFVQTFDEQGELESDFLLIQLKATDSLRRVNADRDLALTFERRDLKAWVVNRVPVFLILYDAASDHAYWLDVRNQLVQDALANAGGNTITLRIPVTNMLDETAVAEMRRIKNG